MTDVHGWHPAGDLPITDEDGESPWLLLLCAESAAPVVGYYTTGYLLQSGKWVAAYGGRGNTLTVRWWRPLDPIPVTLFPDDIRRFVISSGLAFDNRKEDL